MLNEFSLKYYIQHLVWSNEDKTIEIIYNKITNENNTTILRIHDYDPNDDFEEMLDDLCPFLNISRDTTMECVLTSLGVQL